MTCKAAGSLLVDLSDFYTITWKIAPSYFIKILSQNVTKRVMLFYPNIKGHIDNQLLIAFFIWNVMYCCLCILSENCVFLL